MVPRLLLGVLSVLKSCPGLPVMTSDVAASVSDLTMFNSI